MRWKRYAAVAILMALGVAGLCTVWPAGHRPSTAETLTVAESRQIISALLHIVLAERYCADEGLEVILQPYPSGKVSLRAVIDSKADIAAVAEVPFMWAVLDGQPVQVFAEAWNLAARKTFLYERPAAIQKLLRALLKAERFAGVNRQQAIDIVSRQLNLDRGMLATLWENFGFTIGLDQALIVNLEGQARAAAQANPTVLLPNFLHHVHRDGLAAVAPHRVSILD